MPSNMDTGSTSPDGNQLLITSATRVTGVDGTAGGEGLRPAWRAHGRCRDVCLG